LTTNLNLSQLPHTPHPTPHTQWVVELMPQTTSGIADSPNLSLSIGRRPTQLENLHHSAD
jgi:hypothetical protein